MDDKEYLAEQIAAAAERRLLALHAENAEKCLLKPCPFCGSGWLYETRRNDYLDETPAMFCNSCKAVVTWEQVEEEGVNDETRAFVREHWNTRAERTCRNISGKNWWAFECSECGEMIEQGVPEYCPSCGARVKN